MNTDLCSSVVSFILGVGSNEKRSASFFLDFAGASGACRAGRVVDSRGFVPGGPWASGIAKDGYERNSFHDSGSRTLSRLAGSKGNVPRRLSDRARLRASGGRSPGAPEPDRGVQYPERKPDLLGARDSHGTGFPGTHAAGETGQRRGDIGPEPREDR